LVAYVLAVSPTKRSRKNFEYFNCKLQSKYEVYDSVSYKMDIRGTLQEASEKKSPVTLQGYKHIANWKDNKKQDIQMNKKTVVTHCNKADFKYNQTPMKNAILSSVDNIKAEGYDKKLVSVTGYVFVEGSPVEKMLYKTLSYKKECLFQDASGTITLTIWGDFLQIINSDGMYDLKNVAVRKYDDNQISISTTSETLVYKSKAQMTPRQGEKFILHRHEKFPIDSCTISSATQRCPKCNELVPSSNSNQDFFKCVSCRTSTKFSKLPMLFTVKVTSSEAPDTEITIFHQQLKEYFTKRGNISMKHLSKTMLNDETPTMVLNRTNTFVAFI